MRTIIKFTILVFLLAASAGAEEIAASIDRIAVLDPGQEDANNFNRRVAFHFSLPAQFDSVDAKIVYAELHIPFDFSGLDIEGNSTLELQAYPITTSWIDGDANWQSPWSNRGGDLDTLSFYTYTVNIAGGTDVFLDLTEYVKAVVENHADNSGLMFIPNMHEQRNFDIPQNLVQQITDSARLKIVYH